MVRHARIRGREQPDAIRIYVLFGIETGLAAICDALVEHGFTITDQRMGEDGRPFRAATDFDARGQAGGVVEARVTAERLRLDWLVRYGYSSVECPARCHAVELVNRRNDIDATTFLASVCGLAQPRGHEIDWLFRTTLRRGPSVAELRFPSPPAGVEFGEVFVGERVESSLPLGSRLHGLSEVQPVSSKEIWSALRGWAWQAERRAECLR